MGRKLVSREELSKILSDELSSCENCKGTKVKVLYSLSEPDETGCNWSADITLSLGDGVELEHAKLLIAAIVEKNRLLFNLD